MHSFSRRAVALLAFAVSASVPFAADAQTVITPDDPQGWTAASLVLDGSAQITSANPRGLGTGSLELSGGPGHRTRFGVGDLVSPNGFGLLSSLSRLSFDFYRDASSTTASFHTPVFRLIVADPVNAITYRELVWEYEYQFGSGGNVAPTGGWVDDVDLLAGNWYIGGSAGPGCMSLYACLGSGNNFGFSSSAFVYGISIGTGSGWSGTFLGYADDVTYAFDGGRSDRFDFETQAASVPEPSSVALLFAGVAALGVTARRRRTS